MHGVTELSYNNCYIMAFGVGLQDKRKSGVSATPFRAALSLSSARRYLPARFRATGGRLVSRFTMLAER